MLLLVDMGWNVFSWEAITVHAIFQNSMESSKLFLWYHKIVVWCCEVCSLNTKKYWCYEHPWTYFLCECVFILSYNTGVKLLSHSVAICLILRKKQTLFFPKVDTSFYISTSTVLYPWEHLLLSVFLLQPAGYVRT